MAEKAAAMWPFRLRAVCVVWTEHARPADAPRADVHALRHRAARGGAHEALVAGEAEDADGAVRHMEHARR